MKDLPPNKWGLYQMHGNVWEWCADGQREYADKAVADPGWNDVVKPQALGGAARLLRGGGWGSGALFVRSAYRDHDQPGRAAR